jgi:hypothetical protein
MTNCIATWKYGITYFSLYFINFLFIFFIYFFITSYIEGMIYFTISSIVLAYLPKYQKKSINTFHAQGCGL